MSVHATILHNITPRLCPDSFSPSPHSPPPFLYLSYFESRKRVIDDTSRGEHQQHLREVAPWLPSFTPTALPTAIKAPSKRPASPMTGRPLKVSALIPIDMTRETDTTRGETVKFICPVSRWVTWRMHVFRTLGMHDASVSWAHLSPITITTQLSHIYLFLL